MRKTVKINGYDFDALIDTGSSIITLIRESVYQILGRTTLNPTKIKLTSFSKSEIKPFGSFKSTIIIEDNKFMMDIYVIGNSQTLIDVIIGTDVLKQAEIKISANGIELIPKKKDHFINLINVSKAHIQLELKDNAQEVLQLKLKNAEDKCKNLEMHVRNTFTLSLEKMALLDKLHKLEESNLEKVDKLVKLEEKYEILQETFKITEKRLVEKEIECASLTEKILIVCLQHFGFSFAVVSSFSGWPIVKWTALRATASTPLSIPFSGGCERKQKAMTLTERGSERRDRRTRQNVENTVGTEAHR
ncbi:uncharacterized protein TNCV_3278841 [Trichonephila clavipes]|nr:uncharacterized protein TNCV_3278841 [Trichonephila clavipes]